MAYGLKASSCDPLNVVKKYIENEGKVETKAHGSYVTWSRGSKIEM